MTNKRRKLERSSTSTTPTTSVTSTFTSSHSEDNKTRIVEGSRHRSTLPVLSAVAARRAAAEAASRLETNTPLVVESVFGRGTVDDEEDFESDVERVLFSSSSSSSSLSEEEDEEVEQGQSKETKSGRRRRTDNKARGRYYEGASRVRGSEIDNEEESRSNDNDDSRIMAEKQSRTNARKRVRREKSTFTDPACVSRFTPINGENVIRDDAQGDERTFVFLLKESESLVLHGCAKLTVLHGTVELLGAILSPQQSEEPIQHRLFAPSSHPVPPLHAKPLPPSLDQSKVCNVVNLRSGKVLDVTGFSAVVMISDLETGIEGIEKVLTNAQMGCGFDMFSCSEKPVDEWSGKTFTLIMEPLPSLTLLRIPPSWLDALPSFDDLLNIRDQSQYLDLDQSEKGEESNRLVELIEGPKHVGKSTLARMLINRLLTRHDRVAYLDTDLGQPEFTTPGFVSLNIIDKPLLGPSFTHLGTPVSSYYLGSTSPGSDPGSYLASIESLYSDYETISSDNELGSHTSLPHPLPLVINTQGWVKGLGADLLSKIKEITKPGRVLSIDMSEENDVLDFNGYGNDANDNRNVNDDATAVNVKRKNTLEAAPSSPLDGKWTATDLRTLAFVSYFYSNPLSTPTPTPTSTPTPTNTIFERWDFDKSLLGQPPYSINWTNRGALRTVTITNGDVEPDQILYLLNASLVGIVLENNDDDNNDEEENISSMELTSFPYKPFRQGTGGSREKGRTQTTLGLGIIRSIDPSSKSLYLLTPLDISTSFSSLTSKSTLTSTSTSISSFPISFVKGSLEVPLPLWLDHHHNKPTTTRVTTNGGILMRDEEGDGDGQQLPYLSFGNDIAVVRQRTRVRRNVMRRSQGVNK